MAIANGYGSESQVLVASDKNVWIQALGTHLTNLGYKYTVAQSQGDALKILEGNSISAVIAICSEETLALVESLNRKEILSLLIVPDETSILVSREVEDKVDAVLPLSAPYLENLLLNLLKMHFEKRELLACKLTLETRIQSQDTAVNAQRKQIASLEVELETTNAELAQQKRIINEIEILKNAIVRNVSHELRTPLLQVKSSIAMLKEEVKNEKLIEYAENAMIRLEVLGKNITMLGQALDINPNPLILRDAIEYARVNLRRIWNRKGAVDHITVDIERNLPPILADKISTVMQQLLDNAIKFGQNKPITVIGKKLDDGTVYIAVKDEGIGIAEDKLKDIFETFYQVDSSSTRPYGGAGVGLALVKLILDHHNAEIHVDSKLGKGSTFWFTLPYVDLKLNSSEADESD